MKIIVRKSDAVALYKYEDTDVLVLENDRLIDAWAVDASLGRTDVVLYQNVTSVPADFVVGKYLFNGAIWIANSRYNSKTDYSAKLLAEKTEPRRVTKAEKLLDKNAPDVLPPPAP